MYASGKPPLYYSAFAWYAKLDYSLSFYDPSATVADLAKTSINVRTGENIYSAWLMPYSSGGEYQGGKISGAETKEY